MPPRCGHQTPHPGEPYFIHTYNQFYGQVPAQHVPWLKHLDPKNPLGCGAGRGMAMGDQFDRLEAIDRSTKSTFDRGGLPTAVLGLDSKRKNFEADEAADDLESASMRSSPAPRAGNIWFAPPGVTLARLAVNYRNCRRTKGVVRSAMTAPTSATLRAMAAARPASGTSVPVASELSRPLLAGDGASGAR